MPSQVESVVVGEFDLSEYIGSGDTELTTKWCIQKLLERCPRFRELISDGSRVKKINSVPLSAENGFMSLCFRVDAYLTDAPEPLAYCLKEPNSLRMDAIVGSSFYPVLMELHDYEANFYETFDKAAGLRIPRIHSIQRLTADDKKGHIFMDFVANGHCRSLHITESLTLEQTLSIAEQIARLHAFAWANRSQWEGRFPMRNIVTSTLETTDECAERNVQRIREIIDDESMQRLRTLKNIMWNHKSVEYIIHEDYRKAGLPSIVSHGDLWANNILFKLDRNELTNDVAGFVDFQLANEGNPSQDLVRVMLLNMDPNLRRQSEHKVFEYYHEKLGEYLRENGIESPFTLDQLLRAAKPYFIYQLCLAVFIAGNNFLNKEKATERRVFVERLREGLLDAEIIAKEHLSEWM